MYSNGETITAWCCPTPWQSTFLWHQNVHCFWCFARHQGPSLNMFSQCHFQFHFRSHSLSGPSVSQYLWQLRWFATTIVGRSSPHVPFSCASSSRPPWAGRPRGWRWGCSCTSSWCSSPPQKCLWRSPPLRLWGRTLGGSETKMLPEIKWKSELEVKQNFLKVN